MTTALEIALRWRAAVEPKPIKLRKAPRPKWPHKQRAQYYRELLAMLARIDAAVQRVVIPDLDRIVAAHNVTRPEDAPIRSDATGDSIEDTIAALEAEVEAEVPPAKITMLAQDNVVRVTLWHGDELQKQVQQVAKINVWADTTGLTEHLELAVAENVRLITKLKTRQIDDVKGIVLRGARAGVHSSVIAEQIALNTGVSKKRAALIATDQVGKLNGELNQIRQQRLGVRRYRWSSSQDERVRKTHRDLNRSIQLWSKPPLTDPRTGEHAHPGQPVRCRCQPIPIIDDLLVDAGLMHPSDVELQGPTTPLAPVKIPQPPPANMPPTARLQRGGGGASGGGGGSAGGPPTGGGGAPPGPPDEPKRKRLVAELRAGMGALPAKGGAAPKARGAVQSLLDGYGLKPSATSLAQLSISNAPGFQGRHYSNGAVQLGAAVVGDIRAALQRLKRGLPVSELQADAVATMVHEELHGMGAAFTAQGYMAAGRLLEETTTEVLARTTTRDLIGRKGVGRVHAAHPLAFPKRVIAARAYDAEILGVLDDISVIAGVDATRAQDLLQAAAFEFKRASGVLTTPEAYADLFAASVPGLTTTQRTRLAVSLVARGQRTHVVGSR